jgi:FKBP-type peptidyl-prolyl cis-trans isomerase
MFTIQGSIFGKLLQRTAVFSTALSLFFFTACTKTEENKDVKSSDSNSTMSASSEAEPSPGPTELKIEEIKMGSGKEAVKGKTVKANYFGILPNGTKFDNFNNPDKPFRFLVGGGQVIQGLDQGIVGMKVGGKRRLIIPASMGYGKAGQGIVPPNSSFTYEVELVEVQ